MLYYEEGNSRVYIAPDVYVLFGVRGLGALPSYRLWEVGKAPDFVLEVTSAGTHGDDRVEKPPIYAAMGVREYWRFDPECIYMAPPLAGRRLVGGHYQPLPTGLGANGGVTVYSEVLGLSLEAQRSVPVERPGYGAWRLFLRDPITGERLADHEQTTAQRDAALARAEAAEAKAAAADVAAARADVAEAQAAAAAVELAALRARLAQHGDDSV